MQICVCTHVYRHTYLYILLYTYIYNMYVLGTSFIHSESLCHLIVEFNTFTFIVNYICLYFSPAFCLTGRFLHFYLFSIFGKLYAPLLFFQCSTFLINLFKNFFSNTIFFRVRERNTERSRESMLKRETSICCSTYFAFIG